MMLKITVEELTSLLLKFGVIPKGHEVVSLTRGSGSIPTLLIHLESVKDEN